MRTELMSTMNIEDQPLEVQWEHLLEQLEEMVGKRPGDLNGVLFLIGVQELGQACLPIIVLNTPTKTAGRITSWNGPCLRAIF